MADGRPAPKIHVLRWAAGLAVVAAGAVTYMGRARRAPAAPPVERAVTGRGEPLYPPSATALSHGYETVDTNVRLLAIIMVVAIGLMVVGVASVFAMYTAFSKHDRSGARLMTTQQKAVIIPPEPHLQADPYRDIGAAMMEQRHELTTYGWFDADHRQAHIPIGRGMALVVGKPFDDAPSSSAQQTPPDQPATSGGPAR